MQGFSQRSSVASTLAVILTILAALAGSADAATATRPSPPNAAASFEARGSIGEAYAVDAIPGTRLLLVDRRGDTVARGRADRFGSKDPRRRRGGGRLDVTTDHVVPLELVEPLDWRAVAEGAVSSSTIVEVEPATERRVALG